MNIRGSHSPSPPSAFDPHSAKAGRAVLEQNHSNSLGLTQDLGHLGGWVWAAVRWPFRLVARAVRR